ncbi:hypothetical protein BC939DRAFT_443134 [Gamsiella multidivaricata]|uniref:uncharacterized protein n=1 Tax=Gamsiella multidivaricata TaxID=101098 RepID=UPI0022204FA4|nr:uncharacterized protein BC939DRAFT_443134 [Gamsiella multidivaricata]KAI7828862.1 hypothetical protein BC939DRAFT_443134 [Gamsiella multidivaricata]
MSSAYGSIARPVSDQSLATVLPRHATLRSNANADSSTSIDATLFRISSKSELPNLSTQSYTLSAATHPSLVEAMQQVFNHEVERGDTYPQESVLDDSQFENYFFSGDAFVLLKGRYQQATAIGTRSGADQWQTDLLGFFYVKPNFPGRCSHICNGGFIVNPIHRGLGIGSILGKAFLRVVPVIGYKASMFNLVFVSNVASIKLWRRLGFQEIGRIPKAGRLRGQGGHSKLGNGGGAEDKNDNEGFVDAIQFYWDFDTMAVPAEYDA